MKLFSDIERANIEEINYENRNGLPDVLRNFLLSFLGTLVFLLVILVLSKLLSKKAEIFITNRSVAAQPAFELKQKEDFFEFFSTSFSNTDDYSSKSILVYDLSANRPVYSKNSSNRTLIASLTKLASAKVLFDNIDLDGETVISEEVSEIGGSDLELKKDEKYKNIDLIKAGIIQSSNQGMFAVNNLADTVGKMNEYAKALHLKTTNFDNPAGFDEDGNNYSSAEDLVPIAKMFFRNETLKTFSSTVSDEITELNAGRVIEIKTTNDLLKLNTEGVVAGKTGTTPSAAQNLLLLVEKNGRQYLVILLNGIDRYVDAYKVLDRL